MSSALPFVSLGRSELRVTLIWLSREVLDAIRWVHRDPAQ